MSDLIERFVIEYSGKCIQYYGYGAERLPEWADRALDEVLERRVTLFETGYRYPVEGEERAELAVVPFKNGHAWIVLYGGGTPGGETEHICVFSKLQEALHFLASLIRDWIRELREKIEEGELSERDIEHYREQIDYLEDDLRRLVRLLF